MVLGDRLKGWCRLLGLVGIFCVFQFIFTLLYCVISIKFNVLNLFYKIQ